MFRYILLVCAISSVFGCGGGGAGSEPGQAQHTRAVITLATQGSLPEPAAIAGIGVTISLPPGVTVDTDEGGGVANGVITGSGQTASASVVTIASFLPSTMTSAGSLRVVLASTETSGFRVGEFAKVTCAINGGSYPKATDFFAADFRAVDLRGSIITGLSPAFTAVIE